MVTAVGMCRHMVGRIPERSDWRGTDEARGGGMHCLKFDKGKGQVEVA